MGIRPSPTSFFRSRARDGRAGTLVRSRATWLRVAVAGLALLAVCPDPVRSRVLLDKDFQRISEIRTLFIDLTSDIGQALKRPDISTGEADCMKRTLQDLMQASQELGSYEYLITIESQMTDFGDDKALKDILQFAVARALDILETERKHMGELSEECSRFPVSIAKTRQAVQFIDATVAILNDIRPRL